MTDIDNLITAFNNNVSVIWKPTMNFVRDINIIINELKSYNTFINLDIYEILVSCGHDLTWEQNYIVTEEDINWFKNETGKMYFLNSVNEKNVVTNVYEYNSIMYVHNSLCELFELQVNKDD
jgi:hypothetical protein